MKLSEREWRTVSLLERVERCEITVSEAAASLGRSVRQVQRLRKAMREHGPLAVVHGNRGRAPKHKFSPELRAQVAGLRRDKYDGFNDHHFAEKLAELEGLVLSRETVRRVLREAGIGPARGRRAPKHLHRRERRAQAGQMILWDGSDHDWLEGRGKRLCLMAAIDDATGELLPGVHFAEKETSVGYLRLLRDMLRHKGIPQTAYGDRHSSLKRNDSHWSLEEELAGVREKTQVGRALAELGIQPLFAMSPQAKGRVERLFGVLQDRLVSELRLAEAKTRGQANQVLERYRKEHNARFQVAAKDSQSAWRAAPSDHTRVLDACSLHYVRKVRKNNTIRFQGQTIDIPKKPGGRTFADRSVLVKQHLNGHVRVFCDDQCIAWHEGGPRPKETTGGSRTLSAWETRERRRQEKRVIEREDD